MEYEEAFTEEDAQNDGLIKRYAGKQLVSVLRRESGQLFDKFEMVCNERGREPWEVLGDNVVRALNSEDFAQRVADVDINMSKLHGDSLRREDAKALKEFANELGVNVESGDSKDRLDEIFEERLESQLKSPLSGMQQQPGGGVDDEIKQEISSLKREIEEVKRNGGTSTSTATADTGSSSAQEESDLDDAFDGLLGEDEEEGTEEQTEAVEDSDDDVVEAESVSDEDGADDDAAEEHEPELSMDIAERDSGVDDEAEGETGEASIPGSSDVEEDNGGDENE